MPTDSDTPTPVKPQVPSVQDLKKQATSKVASIETQLKSFEGKSGYNPHIWKRDNKWEVLVKGVEAGDTGSIQKVLALPATISPTVKNVVQEYDAVVTSPLTKPTSNN